MKNKKSQVRSYDNLVRDEKTKAVLNTDKNGLLLYKQQKYKNKQIADLQEEVKDLKLMMANILDKLDKWVHKYIAGNSKDYKWDLKQISE